jgi:thioredoxin reductase/NAD-dependent dihydropyrimidine dehydrogenase PreA subunit
LHGHEVALAFEPNGDVTLAGGGFERNIAHLESKVVARTTFVPLVAGSACAECHDLEDARDVAAPCFAANDSEFSLCFDEHRRPATSGAGSAPERDAALEAARVLLRDPVSRAKVAARAPASRNGAYVALALGVVALVVARRRGTLLDSQRARSTRPQAPLAAVRTGARLPVIDAARCLGCHACVDACPYDALAVRRYVAVVERPDACCGAGPCEQSCPNGSLRLVAASSAPRGPLLSATLEVPERPGLFLAGDVTGGTLIRNAVRQGAAVARLVADGLAGESGSRHVRSPSSVDLLVVGAGPAGLAAGLEAQARGLRVTLVDQAGVAASIRRFSRQKLVLDAGAAAEETTPLWLADATKEVLLERWQHAVRKARLDVREGMRVLEVTRRSDSAGYLVRAASSDGESVDFSARNVLLAIGTRGTPRPLAAEIPEHASPRVHYELSDARAFDGRRCVIVGLGDVAMESALALAAQPGAEVTVVHRGGGFARGSTRNIDAVARLAAKGRIRLIFGARVTAVRAASLEIEVGDNARSIGFDALFVHVGTLPSRALLESSGVCLPP